VRATTARHIGVPTALTRCPFAASNSYKLRGVFYASFSRKGSIIHQLGKNLIPNPNPTPYP